MKYVSNRTIADIQDINHLNDILLDLTREPPTKAVLEQIQKNIKRIKKITNKYLEV